jgi:CheY-like chemotaxis protein
VCSEVGAGTTFQVVLPSASRPAGFGEKVPVEHRPPSKATGTVLVIDDDPAVRRMTERALETLGLEVLTATDGQEGVDMFARHSDDIACVLLDMTMPRMSGDEVLRAIRALRPDARVVIMSGYNEQDVSRRFAAERPSGFLQKPFGVDALSAVIGRLE